MNELNPSTPPTYEVANLKDRVFTRSQIVDRIRDGAFPHDIFVRLAGEVEWVEASTLFAEITDSRISLGCSSRIPNMSAPIITRFIAGAIDYIFFYTLPCTVLSILMTIVLYMVGGLSASNTDVSNMIINLLDYFIWGLLCLAYCAYLIVTPLTSMRGTLGMYWMGLEMIKENGEQITFPISLGRWFVAGVLGCCCGLAYLWVFFDERQRTLHDVIMHTLVVQKRK